MAKPYDASIKQMVEAHPADWLAIAGLPASGPIEVIDSDVSSISLTADKVILVKGLLPYIAHLEFQASWDPGLDRRILFYNVILRWKHQLPVRSVVFLLRPQAQKGVTGSVKDVIAPDEFIDFRYRIICIWKEPTELFLRGGLGILPLAPISAVAEQSPSAVQGVLSQVRRRLDREVDAMERLDVWTATQLLLGLRFTASVATELLQGVKAMTLDLRESSVYQAILKEGALEAKLEGKLEGMKEAVLFQAEQRFGPPPSQITEAIQSITNLPRLKTLLNRVLNAVDWDDLIRE